MDVFSTHGAFSWSELMTSDVAGAKQFYAALFGWEIKDMDMPGGQYSTCQVGATSVAGIMKFPADAPPMPPAWGCYVTVADVDATVSKAVELGGKLIVPTMEVPKVGRMAVIQDPEGALLSVITYSMPE